MLMRDLQRLTSRVTDVSNVTKRRYFLALLFMGEVVTPWGIVDFSNYVYVGQIQFIQRYNCL